MGWVRSLSIVATIAGPACGEGDAALRPSRVIDRLRLRFVNLAALPAVSAGGSLERNGR
jgi:hypothetical protein